MKLTFTPSAWTDYLWFQEHDRKLLKRINLLIQDALRTPFEGIGKPELLRPSPAIAGEGSANRAYRGAPPLGGTGTVTFLGGFFFSSSNR